MAAGNPLPQLERAVNSAQTKPRALARKEPATHELNTPIGSATGTMALTAAACEFTSFDTTGSAIA